MSLFRAGRIAVDCKNPECEASWGVGIYRSEGTASCEHCDAPHEYDGESYWLVEDDGP